MGTFIPPRVQCLPPRPDVVTFRGAGRSPLLENSADAPASDEFEARADAAIRSLPGFVREAFQNNGYKVVIGKFLTDAFPHLKGVVPRGWDPWTTWDNSDAVCATPQIGLAEYSWASTVAKPSRFNRMKLLHRSELVQPQVTKPNNVLVKNKNTEFVFRHEAGHMVDDLMEGVTDTRAFEKAYQADVKKLSAREKEELYYYLQPDDHGKPTDAGRSEAFAEAFASLYGGGCNELPHFRKHFRSLIRFTERTMANLKRQVETGGTKTA